MVFTVNGLDMTPYIMDGGLQYERNDVDGPNTGRTLNATLIRDRIASKVTWQVQCRPLTGAQLAQVLTAIKPEFVPVTCTDPETNTTVTWTMYSNNIPATLRRTYNGVDYWAGLSFPLIQQ